MRPYLVVFTNDSNFCELSAVLTVNDTETFRISCVLLEVNVSIIAGLRVC